MKRIRISSVLFVVLHVLFAGQIANAQSDADAVARRLQDKYDSIETLRATFTQTMKSEFLDSSESSAGLFMLNGKQFRVETGTQTFVTDGNVTWLYNAESQELLINDYVEEDMFPVRELIFNYEDKYDIDGVRSDRSGGVPVKVLTLSAKSETDLYRHLTLFVRDSDSVVTRLEILDANDTLMIFELNNIEINPTLDQNLFTFTAPDGVDVIDLRS